MLISACSRNSFSVPGPGSLSKNSNLGIISMPRGALDWCTGSEVQPKRYWVPDTMGDRILAEARGKV